MMNDARMTGGRGLAIFFILLVFPSCREEGVLETNKAGHQAEWHQLGPENWVALDYGRPGSVAWCDGLLQIDAGESLLGGKWTSELPEAPYEVELQAKKVTGSDFFCGLTVPVRSAEQAVTLVLGGWGGGVTGISSIDGKDASENETTSYRSYDEGHWHRIRLEVRADRLAAWVGGEQIVEVSLLGKKVALRPGPIEACAPLGVATWQTAAEMKQIRWRPLVE